MIYANSTLAHSRKTGFTLLELMFTIAIVALLGAVAVPTYDYFLRKSQASEVLLSYDALRESIQAELALGAVSDCSTLADRTRVSLGHDYVDLSLVLETSGSQTDAGYHPALHVCASNDCQGIEGVSIANALHDEFSLTGSISPGAVLTESIVSFSVPIGSANQAACMIAPQAVTAVTPCGPGATIPPTQPQPAISQAPTVLPVPAIAVPAGIALTQEAFQAVNEFNALANSGQPADLAKVLDLAQRLPPALKTSSIPGSLQAAQQYDRCNINPGQACQDNYLGSCSADFGTAMCSTCPGAMVCASSCNLCQGVTPEMQEYYDRNWQQMLQQANAAP